MNSKSPTISKWILHISTIAVISGASACQQSANSEQLAIIPTKTTSQKALTPVIPIKPQALLPTKLHQIKHKDIQFNIVTFDTRNQNLIVADQPNGPGTSWADAEAAAKANNGIAAINAGFFTPEGAPLGIIISNGNNRGSNNPSSLGTGIFHHTATGANISRRNIWSKLSKSQPSHLLQSGPMLLENSQPVIGLSNTSSRVRSFIATDGKNHWCIGHAEACTLAQLSDALSSFKTPEFTPTTALNLDGGRSSDLWVSTSVAGGAKKIRPFWNKPVRNFLILKSN